jgi:molybdopterin molybdotransferase
MIPPKVLSIQSNCTDIYEPGLLPVDLALNKILSALRPIDDYETINIEDAKGRTLAQAITASFSVPRHNNSAVDGYALNAIDIPTKGTTSLTIIGSAFAGKPFLNTIHPGQCVRIMTGAVIPEGADTVIMQEQVELNNTVINIDNRPKSGQNIRLAGEDIQQDETILEPGKFITPADIGLIASLSIAEIYVKRKLKIAIASTGNEVMSIGDTPSDSSYIYDSNRYSLYSALNRPDIEIFNLGILEDNPEALLSSFKQASQYADVIISSGGVSVGDADHTKTALKQSGNVDFWKIAIKPGRPLAFGYIENSVFFGLPGNPVAVMVILSQFVFPALEQMLGINNKPVAPKLLVKTTEDIRKKPGRTEIVRGILEQDLQGDWTVKTTGKQGSGILRSMSLANSFIILEHDRSSVKAGEMVSVQLFSGLF